MPDVFSANPSEIQRGAQLFAEITSIVDSIMRDFGDQSRSVMDWPGVDDSMAKELRPQDEKERKNTTETGEALVDGVSAMVRVVTMNGDYIQKTQNDAFEAIDAHIKGGRKY